MRQLTFDLARPPSYAPDDFLESPSNAEAFSMVLRWPDWPHRTLILTGPSGCGKSHLGAIWTAQAGARRLRRGELPSFGGWHRPIAFLDDCDRDKPAEDDLFHLLNLVRERDGWILITARAPPDLWGVETPDLLSRLRLAPAVTLGRPDATLMRAVIVKLFADRQIHIDEDVVAYAARHCEQSLEAINLFVAAVDEESLAAGRRITRPLAARTIAGLQEEPPASPAHCGPCDQGPT